MKKKLEIEAKVIDEYNETNEITASQFGELNRTNRKRKRG